MNKYLVFLKNPKILFGILLFIISIISIIALTKALKPTPLAPSNVCATGETKISCPGKSIKCAPICEFPDMTWSCNTEKCECNTGEKLCGNQCCTTCDDENNVCCSDEQQYTDGGTKKCCQAGTTPNTSGDGCVASCGELKCVNANEECIIIQGLKDQIRQNQIDSLTKEGKTVDSTTDNNIYVCATRGTCNWSDEKAEPASVNNNYFFHNFSKNGLSQPGNNGISACFPNEDDNQACYDQTDKDNCIKNSCKWANLIDELNDDKTNNISGFNKKMVDRNKKYGRSKHGDYCRTGDVYGRYVRYTSTDPCTVTDCIRQISNKNTVQVGYNEMDGIKYCGAIRVPEDSGMNVKCVKGTEAVDCDQTKDPDNSPGWEFDNCSTPNCPIKNGSQGLCNTEEDNEKSNTDTRQCIISPISSGDQYACANDGQFLDYVPPNKTYALVAAKSGHGSVVRECKNGDGSINCSPDPPTPCCDDGYVLNNQVAGDNNSSDCIYVCQGVNGTALNPYQQLDNSNAKYDFTPSKITGTYHSNPSNTANDRYFCYRTRPSTIGTGDDFNGYCDGNSAKYLGPKAIATFEKQNYKTGNSCSWDGVDYHMPITDLAEKVVRDTSSNDLYIPEFLYLTPKQDGVMKDCTENTWCNIQDPFWVSDNYHELPGIGYEEDDCDNNDVPILCNSIKGVSKSLPTKYIVKTCGSTQT